MTSNIFRTTPSLFSSSPSHTSVVPSVKARSSYYLKFSMELR